MPVIREYNRQFSATGPIETRMRTGDDFGGREARALGQVGQGLQKAGDVLYKRAEQHELSELNAKLSKAQADNAIDFENLVRTAEPGDKNIFEEFNKKADERLNKIGENLSTGAGRNYFRTAAAKIKGQIVVNAAQTQADLDGEKAVIDYTSSKNDLSASLVSDPSSLNLARDLHNQGLDNLVAAGYLPAKEAAKLKQTGDRDLVKSSIRGWIKLDPGFAKEKIASGEFDTELGGDGKIQMLAEVEQAVRAKEVDLERRKRRQQELLQAEQEQTQNEFLKAMSEGNLTTDQILSSNLEAFGSGSKDQFIRMLKAENENGGKLKTSAGTFIALFDRINLPEGDPNKITDESDLNEYLGRGLSYTDLTKLRQEITGNKTEKGRVENNLKKQLFQIAKGQLTKSNDMLGIKDPEGDENMLMFQIFAYDQIEQYRKEGKPIRDLLNPDSKDYLGNYISNYRRTLQEIMRAQMRSLLPTPGRTLQKRLDANSDEPVRRRRKPGESVADYMKYLQGLKAGAPEANAGDGN